MRSPKASGRSGASLLRPALHAVVLLIVLVGGARLTTPGTGMTSDEGAGAYQAVLLGRGHWILPATLAELDPRLARQPFLRADVGERGRAPYGKHPLYPVLLAAGRGAAPIGGLVAVSILGTWVAAIFAGLLAAQLRAGRGLAGMWLVGALSPLAVDATWVLAHAPAAAAGAVTVYGAWQALRPGPASSWRLVGWLALSAGAAGLTVALRTEGALLAAALALGVLVCRRPDRRSLLTAASVLAGAAAVRVLEVVGRHAILGTGLSLPTAPTSGQGFLPSRWQAFQASWVDGGTGDGILLLAGGVLAVAAIAQRRRFPSALVAAMGAAAAALAVVWISRGPQLVPGLLPATAWLGAGAVLVGRRAWAPGLPRLLTFTTVAAALGILASQYSFGGGVEWGGRFYAVLLPGAGALVAGAWPEGRRVELLPLVVPLVAVAGLLTTGGLLVVRAEHQLTDRVERQILLAAAVAPPGRPGDPDGRPVVFSDRRLWPQLMWRSFDGLRWVTVEAADAPCALADLRASGFQRIVVTANPLSPFVRRAADAGWKEDPGFPPTRFARVLAPSSSAPGRPECPPPPT